MPKRTYEKYAIASGLGVYLDNHDWNVGEVLVGFQDDVPVTVPAVSIYYLPSRLNDLQMGREQPEYLRRIQIDAYMETEGRAESIGDDIADFIDQETVLVIDADTASGVAYVRCYDTGSIYMDTLPPNFTDTKLKRWREVVQATLNVDYFNDLGN